MININVKIELFIKLLNASWSQICILDNEVQYDSFKQDWLQFNWELIFEDGNIKLEIYGDGADINGDSSRVSFPKVSGSHAIHCHSKNNSEVKDVLNGSNISLPKTGSKLDRLVTIKGGWYYEEAPFDCVLMEFDDYEVVVKVRELDFFIQNS